MLTLTLLGGFNFQGRQTLCSLLLYKQKGTVVYAENFLASTATCYLAFITSDARQYTRRERPFEGRF